MRFFITIFLAGVLSILTALLIGTLTIKSSGLSVAQIKHNLVSQNFYLTLHQELLTLVEAGKTSKDDDLVTLLTPFIKTEITPAYLQTKTETLLDDSHLWMTNQATASPVLSFTDLKTKLLKKNAKLVRELLAAAEAYEKERPQLEQNLKEQAEVSGEPIQSLPSSDGLVNFIKSDFVFPIGQYLGGIKLVYNLAYNWFYYLILIYITVVVIIIYLNLPSPWQILGKVILSTLLLNLPPLIMAMLLNQAAIYTTINTNIPQLLEPAISILIQPLFASYLTVAKTVLGSYVVIALIFLFVPIYKTKPITKNR